MRIRPAAVAGSWYPGSDHQLRQEIAAHLQGAGGVPPSPPVRSPVALVAPHAGLMYSGPVAAHAYRHIAGQPFDALVLVGPSHYVDFDGVSIIPSGQCATPCGPLGIDEPLAAALMH